MKTQLLLSMVDSHNKYGMGGGADFTRRTTERGIQVSKGDSYGGGGSDDPLRHWLALPGCEE